MSELLLQKSADRASKYHAPPGIWYSKPLRRWMVTSPDLIREAMLSDKFSVPSYDASALAEKLGLDFGNIDKIRSWMPLAVEGEEHKRRREQIARSIALNTAKAKAALERELEARSHLLRSYPAGKEFCFYAEFLKPAMRSTIRTLAGAEFLSDDDFESLPLLFDDACSIKTRTLVNKIVGELLDHFPADWEEIDRTRSLCVIALGANTLLGSLSLTFLESINRSEVKRMSKVDWGPDLLQTSLALIEKYAVEDTFLGETPISVGERVRLFIESDGVPVDEPYRYSDLFFAVGKHKCLGMNFSKQAWNLFAESFSRIDRTLEILEVQERSSDYVFNYPEQIRARFTD